MKSASDDISEKIRIRLERLPPPCTADGHRLLKVTRAFLTTPHCQTASALGWSVVELFAIEPRNPVSIHGNGLVTWLALARPGRLVAMTDEAARISRDALGLAARDLHWVRSKHRPASEHPWWECQDIMGEYP